MKKPRNIGQVPEGDWRYEQPETGMKFRSQHWKELQGFVWDYRNSVPELQLDTTGGWVTRFWSNVCEQNHYYDCIDAENPGRYPNLSDAWNWVKSMEDWRKTGFDTVPQEEAERRAAICAKCPHNRIISGCWGCKGVGEQVSKLSGGKTTSIDQNLHMCDVCLCVIKAKVHLPREVIHTDGLDDKWPSFCWLAKE